MTVLQGIQPLGAPAEITRALRFRFPRSTRLASRGATILFAATLPFCGGAFAQSLVPTVPALLQQVGSKLVGGGATNPANQGSAVALSTDGNNNLRLAAGLTFRF